MSFILDALRKSEHERQRSATPGIAQVPFGAPRRELPAWAIGLIVVLTLAVLALGGAWLRSEWSGGAREARERSPADVPVTLPPAEARRAPSAERAAAREAGPRSLGAQSSVRGPAASPSPAPALVSAVPADRERAEPPASLVEPATAPPPRKKEPVLPSAAALAAEGIVVPPLQLQLLAYYDSPADRYVFINGTKYVEGATLAEGPKVVSIEASGAVLSYLGHQFLLSQ